jgi:P-type Cu+ transporter
MVGTGRGAKHGVLLRDVDALQKAEKIDTVVLDKTGTITLGKPSVAEVVALNGVAEDELLSLAASAEQFSEHPVAKAIVAHAREKGMRLRDPESFNNEPGMGVSATIDGRALFVGSEKLLSRSTGFQPVSSDVGHGLEARATRVLVADQFKLLGAIMLTDTLKSDSAAAVKSLHGARLRTVLLTGDNPSAAEAIAREVGIDEIHAGVLPSGKADVIRQLQSSGRTVAMVGDGVNDAPALAQADLGIAIGSGSDIAKETGDVVLVSGSLHGIVEAIGLSRATMRVIRQNLFFAFFYNVLAIPLAAAGMLSPLIAAAAMALSDITVLGNALRLRRGKLPIADYQLPIEPAYNRQSKIGNRQ